MYKEILKQFKKARDRLKQSGNHGQFWKYCNGNTIIYYMDLLLANDPDMLEKVYAHLPQDIFAESQSALPLKK